MDPTLTLSTNVYVLDPVDVRKMFAFCQNLLTKYDEQHRPPEAQECHDKPHNLYNQLGQGLPAILDIHHGNGAPLRAEDADHDEWCDEECTGTYHDRACWADINLDTGYAYRDERGWGCGDLHAAMVGELGQWLDKLGVRWEWRNEFTGDVWGGDERYTRLAELGEGGAQAGDWYRTVALPAIVGHVLSGGEG